MTRPSSPTPSDAASKDKPSSPKKPDSLESTSVVIEIKTTAAVAADTSASSPSPVMNSSRAGSAPTSDTALSDHCEGQSTADAETTLVESSKKTPSAAASPDLTPQKSAEPNADPTADKSDAPEPPTAATQDDDDVEMKDVSPVSSTKTRSRDEEDAAAPAPKRAKTQASSPMQLDSPSKPTNNGAPPPAPSTEVRPTPPPSAYLTEIMEKKHWDSEPITEAQSKFLLEQIRKAKKTNNGNWYREPVNPEKLNIPTYFEIVAQPMDLSTIESKIKSNSYDSTDKMMEDFDLMIHNSNKFNGPQHPVTQAGFDLKAYFIKLMAFLPGRDQASFKKTPKVVAIPRAPQPRRGSRSKLVTPAPVKAVSPPNSAPVSSFALPPDGIPLIRRGSAAADRPKREIHRPPPRDLPYADAKPQKRKYALELRFARQAINSLFKQQHADIAYPFLAPVDPVALNIPDYHTVIKRPMDFRTIKEKLANNGYTKAQETHDDALLVFSNCFRYNEAGTPVCAMGQALKKVFEAEWEKKDAWMAQHAPAPAPEPVLSEEEEEEEEEFELKDEAERLEKMRVIQEEITKLQAESMRIMGLTTREGARAKGRPPKHSGRGDGKSKPKAKKPAAKKETKPKKIPTLTLDDKQQIADFIAGLDPGSESMATVINMIRSGMPNVTEEDDIEISVDDIPNAVLYELQKFIYRQTEPASPDADDDHFDDDDYDDDPEYIPSKKGRASGGGRGRAKGGKAGGGGGGGGNSRRKNKPMKPGEQERKIQEVTATLARFQQDSGPESPADAGPAFAAAVESSSDESESESEEE